MRRFLYWLRVGWLLCILLIAAGGLAAAAGNPGVAMRRADADIAAHPSAAMPYVHRAELWLDRSEPVKAEADLRSALLLQPDCTDAYLGLGTMYAGIGEMKKAREAYDKAVAIAPQRPEVYAGRAFYYDMGIADFTAALADIDKAIYLAPAEQKTSFGLRRSDIEQRIHIYTHICDKRLGEDLSWLLAQEDLPVKERLQTLLVRVNFYLEYGEYEKALLDNSRLIGKLLDRPQALAQLYCQRGQIYTLMQDEKQAVAAYKRAQELDPSVSIPKPHEQPSGGK